MNNNRYSVTKTILLSWVDLVSFILLCIYLLLHIDNYDNVLGSYLATVSNVPQYIWRKYVLILDHFVLVYASKMYLHPTLLYTNMRLFLYLDLAVETCIMYIIFYTWTIIICNYPYAKNIGSHVYRFKHHTLPLKTPPRVVMAPTHAKYTPCLPPPRRHIGVIRFSWSLNLARYRRLWYCSGSRSIVLVNIYIFITTPFLVS